MTGGSLCRAAEKIVPRLPFFRFPSPLDREYSRISTISLSISLSFLLELLHQSQRPHKRPTMLCNYIRTTQQFLFTPGKD